MHAPCFRQEEWRARVEDAVGDSPGQMPQRQKGSALLPGEGRSPGQTEPRLTQHAGEEAGPASCHATVCMRFSHLGAGSHLQQTVCCSTYAFHSPHPLLNAFLV